MVARVLRRLWAYRRGWSRWVASFAIVIIFGALVNYVATPKADCADRVMTVLVDPSTAPTAYACLSADLQRTGSEQEFALLVSSLPRADLVWRVGSSDHIVFYVARIRGESVPFTLYLDQEGHVWKMA